VRLVGLLVVLIAASAAGASTSPPALRVARITPLIVTGTHFRAHEHVRITATSTDTRASRSATAAVDGSFRVGFGDLVTDRCSGVRVVAVGVSGSHAAVKAVPMCPPAASP
jgi:xanthine dehydrogenase molybdopterin-binding subunit B